MVYSQLRVDPLMISFFLMHYAVQLLLYGDSVDNTVEENSSVFFLIITRWLPPARACGQ